MDAGLGWGRNVKFITWTAFCYNLYWGFIINSGHRKCLAAQQLQVQFKMSPANNIACWYYLLALEQIHNSQFSSSKESDEDEETIKFLNIVSIDVHRR